MFLYVSLLLLVVIHVDRCPHEDTQWEERTIKYMKECNDDEGCRRNISEQNVHMTVAHHQEAEQSYKLWINHLTNMIQVFLTFFQPDSNLPTSIDYRQLGLVTSVKYQGHCGCCWAFSAVGALEGQLAKKTGRLVDLSTKNLLDCVDNKGCGGGHMIDAFEYMQSSGGINSEKDYPYINTKETCRFNSSAIAAQCRGFRQIPVGNEYELAKALYEVGPLSVSIDFRHVDMLLYTGGVYYNDDCDKDKPNHSVLLVGLGVTAEGEEYWIVKNSWGEDWGEEGYMRIARNRDNHCGIATDASYPLV